MWRAFFLGLGAYVTLLGLECLVIDKAFLAGEERPGAIGRLTARAASRELTPPDWAPWSLLSAGAVTMLYSLTLYKGGGKEG